MLAANVAAAVTAVRSKAVMPSARQRSLGAAVTLLAAATGTAFVGFVSWFWLDFDEPLAWLSPLYLIAGIFCFESWRMTRDFLRGDLILKGAAPSRPWPASGTILVVESEPRLSCELAAYGFKVVQASSGFAAIDQVKLHPELDLVFADAVLPGVMDGVALAAWITVHHPNLIMMAEADNREMLDALRKLCGSYAFEKPCDAGRVAGKIRKALSIREAQKVSAGRIP